nr:zinc finger protein 239-like [Nothobranchius furzeri]XP_054590678.1 zinc finger protein 239-like [Nothobranchius furzeri]XP_054590679.1 zinc finger protein 239-like [Nothobranchius furzeri]
MALVKEDPEEQSDVDQQNPEHLHIKEEEEELCTSLEGEQLHLEQETDAVRFPFTAVSIKSEDDAEKPVLSQLHHQQIEDRDVPTSSSDDQMTAGTGGEGETSRNSDLNPHEQTSDSDLSDFWPESGGRDNDSIFSCPECGKQFFQKWSLQTHLRVMGHSAISSSDCLVNKCDGVKQPVDSRRKAQTELKLFSCDDCGKRFGTKSNLNSHMNVHTGQKRFACELCGQRFSHKTSLNRHLRVHTGQKPFACGHCGQRFSRKTTLNTHRRVHTGQKPFACGHCGQRFSQRAHLNSHIRVHTGHKPFACSHCGKRFSRKSLLNGHIRVHTGQKPFACELCGQRFSQKTSLNRHLTVHTGKKPFACELCGQRFSQKTNLNRHMRVYTGHKELI